MSKHYFEGTSKGENVILRWDFYSDEMPTALSVKDGSTFKASDRQDVFEKEGIAEDLEAGSFDVINLGNKWPKKSYVADPSSSEGSEGLETTITLKVI